MKLTKILTEADPSAFNRLADHGDRNKLIKNITTSIEENVKAAGYDCKVTLDKEVSGFYILPAVKNQLLKLTIDARNQDNKIILSGKILQASSKIDAIEVEKELSTTDVTSETDLTNDSGMQEFINSTVSQVKGILNKYKLSGLGLSESLDEFLLPHPIAGIASAIRNKIQNHRENKAEKEKEKVASTILNNVKSTVINNLEEVLRSDIEEKHLQKSSDNELIISNSFIVGVGFDPNPNSNSRSDITVSKVICFDGQLPLKNSTKFNSLDKVLQQIGKVLNISFNISGDEMTRSGSTDDEVTFAATDILRDADPAIRAILGEALDEKLTSSDVDKVDAAYKKAQEIAKKDQKIGEKNKNIVIKYFFEKKYNLKNLSDEFLDQFKAEVLRNDHGYFSTQNPQLRYIDAYIVKNGISDPTAKNLYTLIKIIMFLLNHPEKAKMMDKYAVIDSKFYNSNETAGELAEKCVISGTFRNLAKNSDFIDKLKNSDKALQMLANIFGKSSDVIKKNLDTQDKNLIKNAAKNGSEFRNLDEIKKIESIFDRVSGRSFGREVEITDTDSNETSDIAASRDKLKQILKDPTDNRDISFKQFLNIFGLDKLSSKKRKDLEQLILAELEKNRNA